ncbi:SCO-spondin-like [Branchiostoma floridae x Branchiostoma belcheri]
MQLKNERRLAPAELCRVCVLAVVVAMQAVTMTVNVVQGQAVPEYEVSAIDPALCITMEGWIVYDPLTHTCCPDGIYEGAANRHVCKACGQTTFVMPIDAKTSFRCCGEKNDIPYDPETNICCFHKLLNGPEASTRCIRCGMNVVSFPATESSEWLCCGEENVPYNGQTHHCCYNEVYEGVQANYECHRCGETVFSKPRTAPAFRCCGARAEIPYDPTTHHCCEGFDRVKQGPQRDYICNRCGTTAFSRQRNEPHYKCCGANKLPYNPARQHCCFDELKDGPENEFVCQRCISKTYSRRVTEPSYYCCGLDAYNKETHTCCGGKLWEGGNEYNACQTCGDKPFIRPASDPEWHCCGPDNTPYNPATHFCCQGSVRAGAEDENTCLRCGNSLSTVPASPVWGCCGEVVFNIGRQVCCGGHVYQGNICDGGAVPAFGAPVRGSSVEGSSVVGSSVEGSSVERSSVEGSSVDGSVVGSKVEGSSVEGSSVEGSSVEGSSVEGHRGGPTDNTATHGGDRRDHGAEGHKEVHPVGKTVTSPEETSAGHAEGVGTSTSVWSRANTFMDLLRGTTEGKGQGSEGNDEVQVVTGGTGSRQRTLSEIEGIGKEPASGSRTKPSSHSLLSEIEGLEREAVKQEVVIVEGGAVEGGLDLARDEMSVDGGWSPWGEWSRCSKTCGRSWTLRRRTCDNPRPTNGGKPCLGPDVHKHVCNPIPCPGRRRPNAGGGTASSLEGGEEGGDSRVETVGGTSVQQGSVTNVHNRVASLRDPIHGGWGFWTPWSSCTATCGKGARVRTRQCSNPPPSGGGDPCKGTFLETDECLVKACPESGWSMWGPWTACTLTCGGGYRKRTRECSINENLPCEGPSMEEASCNPEKCPVDGGWTKWSKWTPCTRTCGPGSQTRTRSCTDPAPRNGGMPCNGTDTMVMKCIQRPCPQTYRWSRWSSCSVTCGRGIQKRTSVCVNMEHCGGLRQETKRCNRRDCPREFVNEEEASGDGGRHQEDFAELEGSGYAGREEGFTTGTSTEFFQSGWGEWSPWTGCIRKCTEQQGYRYRSRECNSVEGCDGFLQEEDECDTTFCAADGNWGGWSEWSGCSVTCGEGTRERTRSCDNPAPQQTGKPCEGSSQEIKVCSSAEPCDDGVHGGWSKWSNWTDCSVTCGRGVKARARDCNTPAPRNGGSACEGRDTEEAPCDEGLCPVDGGWSSWSQWLVCTATCGIGTQIRLRACDSPLPMHGGKNCSGSYEDLRVCKRDPCPEGNDAPNKWSDWSEWSDCSVTCGKGMLIRTRKCPDGGCAGRDTEERDCHTDCRQFTWTKWSDWTTCTKTCGKGIQQRTRACADPGTGRQADVCDGEGSQKRGCNAQRCSREDRDRSNWEDWSPWEKCSVSCGVGVRFRFRKCKDPTGNGCWGSAEDEEKCDAGSCLPPIDGGWSDWTEWTECSHTCGIGTRKRTRKCDNPPPQNGGKDCEGQDMDAWSCASPCPIDGGWSPWSSWSPCDVTCEEGQRRRTRQCDHPRPRYGGRNCTGDAVQVVRCSGPTCPVSGGWGEWTEWSECSHTCGLGSMRRKRLCDSPAPSAGGQDCQGVDMEIQPCSSGQCPQPVDGGWSPWSNWTVCTVSCGGGTQSRSRTCDSPVPDHGGRDCEGTGQQFRRCSMQACHVDGQWGKWDDWSECTATCGGGYRVRRRRCDSPEPRGEGVFCPGVNYEDEDCNTQSCDPKLKAHWSEWTDWSTCSATCGEGEQVRTRTCLEATPGDICAGQDTEIQPCNMGTCKEKGLWSPWSVWTACSATCGGGVQRRTRYCELAPAGAPCEGPYTMNRTCETPVQCPAAGRWRSWSAWSTCSVSCGSGRQFRTRACEESPAGGGCDGPEREYQLCSLPACDQGLETSGNILESAEEGEPGKNNGDASGEVKVSVLDEISTEGFMKVFSTTTASTTTSATTTSTTTSSGANVIPEPPTAPEPDNANASPEAPPNEVLPDDRVDSGSNEILAAENRAVWSEWTDWTECSLTCGKGQKARFRECRVNGQVSRSACEGASREVDTCIDSPCAIDGSWASWSKWSACSVTCGQGTKIRVRECSDPEPQFGGRQCPGRRGEIAYCNATACPIHGGYGQWSEWTECYPSCGRGLRNRTRKCDNPRPQFGGDRCRGLATIRAMCDGPPCPINGGWSDWTTWSRCAASCGVGQQIRFRTCKNPPPQHGGKECAGSRKDARRCWLPKCPDPVNGNWSDWSSWTECSVSCGLGLVQRTRQCDNPPPQHGGICLGNSTEFLGCDSGVHCDAVNGQWASWGPWQPCGGDCAGKTLERSRTCSDPAPQYGGKDCVGIGKEARTSPRSCRQKQEFDRADGKGLPDNGVHPILVGTETVPVFCDFRRHGGGWTLLINSMSTRGWEGHVTLRNADSPNLSKDYSILKYADAIRDTGTEGYFEYRIEADDIGKGILRVSEKWGGIWRAPNNYTFTARNASQQGIELVERFPPRRDNDNIDMRMPWIPPPTDTSPALLTSSERRYEYDWWGTIISKHRPNSYYTNPIHPYRPNPARILYWMREGRAPIYSKS